MPTSDMTDLRLTYLKNISSSLLPISVWVKTLAGGLVRITAWHESKMVVGMYLTYLWHGKLTSRLKHILCRSFSFQ